MGILDFLDDLGESRGSKNKSKTDKYLDSQISHMQILESRGLFPESFKNQLLELYISKKIDQKLFEFNIADFVKKHENIKFKFIELNESAFKLKSNVLEYVGEIDKFPSDEVILNPNNGKISYDFAKALFGYLKDKEITLKQVNDLSDFFGVRLLSVYMTLQDKEFTLTK